MKKNVNLMQNPEDIIFDKESSYSKEYLIQALANLGQRIGIKGDGISYKSFNFMDILLDNTAYDVDKKIGYIEYIKDDYNNKIKALFGIADKENLEISETIAASININNTLNFGSDLSFSIPVNGIEKYSKGSICINNDNELTFMLIGKLFGYNDNDANNSVLMYYKFDILINKLICGYKLFHYLKDDKGDNYYCLLRINNKTNDTYELDIHVFNSSELINDTTKNIYKNEFENIFNFSTYSDTDNSLIPFSLANDEYTDVNELLAYNEVNLDFNSAVSIILNLPSNSVYHSKHIEMRFDSSKNELLSPESFEDAKEFYYNEYQLDLNEEIFNINEDINKLYVNIFNYYNEKFYLEKRATLIKRILSKIYEKSIDYKTITGKRLYIPLDYEFHYICNSNNELNIYYSNNIYITYTSLKNIDLSEFWKLNNNLVFDYEELNKLKVYNFEINYNRYIENLINSIVIKDVYTMPYINAANNWSINDSDTKIKAVGKDAGNPNIIILFNNDINDIKGESFEILNAVSNKEKVFNADYKQRWFNVHPALFDNTYDVKIECCAYIPEVTNINYEYFKDSVIFSISDLNCLKDESYKDKYKGSYILTFWRIVETEDELSFECINQVDSEFALALGSTVNLFNELSDESIANLNSQDLILLKSIISNIGHERLNVNMNNWLIIKNKQSEEYDTSNNEYNNDLNIIMQYDDNIKIKTNHIVHSHTSSRYISDIDNIQITNSLYPKYEYITEDVAVSPNNITVIIKKLNTISVRDSSIVVNGNKIDNVESLIERLKIQNKIESIQIENEIETIKTSTIQKLNSNYYEYIFNSNVPTLDYKEIFNRNFNLLNRLNIVSIDNNGSLYNAYVGTSYNESDKSTLHIGTSNLNINVGTDTLIKEVDKNKFKTHNTLSLDFENIKLNADKSISLSKEVNYKYNLNNIDFAVSTFKLLDNTGIFITRTGNVDTVTMSSDSLFATSNDNEYYVCVNSLIKRMNRDISIFDKVNINCKQYNNIKQINYRIGSNNIKLYFVKLDASKLFTSVINNSNIIYSSECVEVMYYENTYYVQNTTEPLLEINIFLSFK